MPGLPGPSLPKPDPQPQPQPEAEPRPVSPVLCQARFVPTPSLADKPAPSPPNNAMRAMLFICRTVWGIGPKHPVFFPFAPLRDAEKTEQNYHNDQVVSDIEEPRDYAPVMYANR